jgi:hypothetical protein
MEGLGSLVSMGASFSIEGNNSLTSLEGLTSFTEVPILTIEANDSLANLDGLTSLTSVSMDVMIGSNPNLPDCEVCDLIDQLTTYSSISVENNLDDSCTPVPDNCP